MDTHGSKFLMSIAVAWSPAGLLTISAAIAQERDIVRDARRDASTEGRRVALIIGVDDYEDPQIADLQYTDEDARGMASALIQSGSFAREDVIQMLPGSPDIGLRPSRANILTQLARLQSRRDLEMLVVYFSGHGSAEQVKGGRENYIFPQDTRMEVLELTGLKVADLLAQAEAVDVRTRVIIFDACRNDPNKKGAGDANGFQDERYELAEGTQILYGAKFGEPAYEEPRLQHGAFTAYLLEGLSGRADGWQDVGPTDAVISLKEAYQYASDRLLAIPRDLGPQKPYLSGEGYGDFALTLVPSSGPLVQCPSSADELAAAQDGALQACADPARFQTQAAVASSTLTCLHEPLTPELAIRGHQIEALSSLSLLDRDAAARALRSATLASQQAGLRLELPADCAPDDALRAAADGIAVGTRPSPAAPKQGEILVDGQRDGTLHEGVPSYVQVRWDKRFAEAPTLLRLGQDDALDPTPLYSDLVEPEDSAQTRIALSNRLLVGGGGAALAAGGLMVGALVVRKDWERGWEDAEDAAPTQSRTVRDATYVDLEAQWKTMNGLWRAGQVAGGVALGLGVASLTVRF